MMQQYLDIKGKYKDYLLFYRLGDFYEMFYDDALTGSKELELTLTGKDCGQEERAPMCGIPYHSAESYISRLVGMGYKVAVCEQLEDPSTAKGLVKRDVTRIVTPGTITDTNALNDKRYNYIAAIYVEKDTGAAAFVDMFNGTVNASEYDGAGFLDRILNDVGTYMPSEILTNVEAGEIKTIGEFAKEKLQALVTDKAKELFSLDKCRESIERQDFGNKSEFFENASHNIIKASGALVNYLCMINRTPLIHLNEINFGGGAIYMELDLNTRRNLELCESSSASVSGNKKTGSLLWAIDRTKTSQGARMLRKWLEHPLINGRQIMKRQDAVAELCDKYIEREKIASKLSTVYDIERIITKIMYNNANPRDIKKLGESLYNIPDIKETLRGFECGYIKQLNGDIDNLSDIYGLIAEAIEDNDIPMTVRDGGVIKNGYNENLDELRCMMAGGEEFISKIESEERERTGIKTLKIGYNKVFGYYIEITKSYLNQVPARYIRKQTLANCERFITEELKEKEVSVLSARDKAINLEGELFGEICMTIAGHIHRFQTTATSLAILDALYSLAETAVKNSYVRPEINSGEVINIKDGRHPVVELTSSGEYFVPNDVYLDTADNRLYIITGPNMAGKSTYMRQVAVITLLSQIGSFVPAASAQIGITDKIFTRIGASDDLYSGRSTFLLEMNEVAYILKNATKRSLIIYDEIGRGTSTFDGMSIARAVLEYTAGKKLSAKTLFATHYHELTELENQIEGVKNYNIAAKKRNDEIVFLRKIVKGAADDSYGIEVAKLAGIDNDIIKRAKEILESLESGEVERLKVFKDNKPVKAQAKDDDIFNLSLDDYKKDEIYQRIEKLDLNIITPIEAFNILFDLKKQIKS